MMPIFSRECWSPDFSDMVFEMQCFISTHETFTSTLARKWQKLFKLVAIIQTIHDMQLQILLSHKHHLGYKLPEILFVCFKIDSIVMAVKQSLNK